ncbi:hypothetical protein OVA13_02125 [Pseudoxanthomonas sp. SL93]|uniref:hypothetical protein n=1 Tax=Pseudoxanthomonas sp. SL93 TaxID=2995142 RepID=UPI00226F04E5|nr:hypothetical protein [Pseudoxanthomonas sp. SL93]WAC63612.1 hypothetical protein OVA13_02125 [Pseudoxanthomonas sp. SL93]
MTTKQYCLAIYDWDTGVGCLDIFNSVKEYFLENDFFLHDFSVLVSGWPRSKKLRIDQIDHEIKNRSDVKSIEGSFLGDCKDGYFFITGSASPASFAFVRVPIYLESETLFNSLIDLLSSKLKISYGCVFCWDKDHDSMLYALGITHQISDGDPDELQSEGDARWFNERIMNPPVGRRFKNQGMFRDVYDANIINESHLNCTVGGLIFTEAVRRNSWGRIIKYKNSTWVWITKGADVKEIVSRLSAEGLLIQYERVA